MSRAPLKKCGLVFAAAIFLTLALVRPVLGAGEQVTVEIPAFPLTLNQLQFHKHNQDVLYPPLVFKGVTYLPLTDDMSNLMNLNTDWTAEGGLAVASGNPETPKAFSYETPVLNQNSGPQIAAILDTKISVNGKEIDNSKEPYPLLRFRDMAYLPLTWRFAAQELGWDYTFDPRAGLRIEADNFFYTTNVQTPFEMIDPKDENALRAAGSYTTTDGTVFDVGLETHYIKGDMRIFLKTSWYGRLTGPAGGNLEIVRDEIKTTPDGWFGYYVSEKGPQFTVEGPFIHTTYHTSPPMELPEDEKSPLPCTVDIATGSVTAGGIGRAATLLPARAGS